jgi:F0F1-type ATP synthase membrane subunit b/b'
VDIQRELDKLEEIVLGSPRVPLTRRTMVDEDQLIYQLDLVRLNLPSAFQEAVEIVRHKEEILQEAEQYAQEIIETAERRAAQILDEMNLRRQADLEVQQLRQRVQQECEAAQEQTLAEIDRVRRQAQLEIEEARQLAIAESEDIQAGADAYADRVLRDMEQRLSDMLRVIRNGRHQLKPESPQRREEGTPNRPGQTGRPPERPNR